MKRIRQGNTIHFRYSVYRSSGSQEEEEDLTGIEVTTSLQNRLYGTLVDVPFSIEGNVITGEIPGIPYLRTGVYNFCLSYQKDGTDFAVDTDAFQIVDSSSKAGGESACPHVEVETVEVRGVVEFGIIGAGGIEQVQADWEEDNPQSKAFIKRKPDLKKVATSGSYKDLSDTPTIPTVSNDFTNEEKEKLRNIERYVKDLSLVPTDNLVRLDISAYDPAAGTASTKSEFLNLATGELAGLMSALDKRKLSTLSNYDDTGLRTALQSEINRAKGVESTLDSAIEKVASDLSSFITGSPDADDIINRWQEVTAFLNGITEDKTLSGMLLAIKTEITESVTAKLADYYTSARIDDLFVKKLVGSRLITEEEATKLAGLENYDDTAIVDRMKTLEDKQPVMLDITDWYTLAYRTPSVRVGNLEIPSGWKELLEIGVNNGLMVTFKSQLGDTNSYHATVVKTDILGAIIYRVYFHFIWPDMVMNFSMEVNYTKDGKPGISSCILEYAIDVSAKANKVSVINNTDMGTVSIVYDQYYNFSDRSSLNLKLTTAVPNYSGIYHEYMFEFTASIDAMPLNITNADGSTVKWITEPDIKAGKTYQVSIVNNLAVIGGA